LVMSYFHEYFKNENGKKTLRGFTKPINLKMFDHKSWMNSKEELWYIAEYLADAAHIPLISKEQIETLRPATLVERRLGGIVEWVNGRKKK